ncbi:hypothetical protein DPMN_110548 [Dreissena polymorpha]|uniref:Uncharacterized protein n=1 Tax=Dreissena polymorpha TaxID=45954 RepID=A0A9D4KCT2_DREPO|nr:hypothetical protein DPMN_110548 [Dreissena polymorpha]
MRIDEDNKEKKRIERELRNRRALDNNDAREDSARIIQQYERDYTDESERFSDLSELNTIDKFLNESTSRKVIEMSDERGSTTREHVENTPFKFIDDHI